MKQKLQSMFKCAEYFYNKAADYLITNYFPRHVEYLFNQFIKASLKYKEECKFDETSIQDLTGKLIIDKFVSVKFANLQYFSNKYKLIDKRKFRDLVLPTKMAKTHNEYWTFETPHHIKETAIFEAYTNYNTAIINYMCKVLCKLLHSIRTKLKFKLPEFSLKHKQNTYNIGIKKTAIKFAKNTFLVKYMKDLTYSIDSLEKSRCMRLIDGNFNRICDSKLISDNGNYFLCLVLNIKSKKSEPVYNIASIDPGVRTFQTVYSPEGVISKLGNNYNQLLVNKCKQIDKYNLIKDRIFIPPVLLLNDEQKSNTKSNRRRRHRLNKRINKKWKKIKNIVEELHKSTANYLVNNFQHILIPETNIKNMMKSYKRKINKTTVRGLSCLAHYKFRERLKQLAQRKGNNVVEVSEAYTSKTCGLCGFIDEELGGKKIFECKCGYVCDRDIHGARNIYIRALNNIWERSSLE